MANYSDAIAKAKEAGYSDSEIADFLAPKEPGIGKARDAGYKDADILGHLGGATPAPEAPKEGVMSDLGKSAGGGLELGFNRAMSFPHDIVHLAGMAVPEGTGDAIKSYSGPGSVALKAASLGSKFLYDNLPSAEDVEARRVAAAKAGGKASIIGPGALVPESYRDPNYEPQHAPGRYAKSVAAEVPLGLMTGMGLPATVASGVFGQGAYDLTGSEGARAVASLVGGVATPLAIARAGRKAARPLLDADQLKSLGDAGYHDPMIRDTAISPQATAALAGDMEASLNAARSKFSPARAPETTADIQRLGAAATHPNGPPAPVTIEELHNFRKDLRETAKKVGPDFKPTEEAHAAIRAQRVLNQYLENIPSRDVVRGNPIDAVEALNTAGKNWGAYSTSDRFGNIIENAQHRAAGQGSGANFGNVMRQEAYKLLKDGGYRGKQMGITSPEAQTLLNKLNTGDFGTNMLRRASNYMGGGGGVANHVAAAIFGHAAGPLGYISGMTLGPALRAMSNAKTLGTARKLEKTLLSKAPINAQITRANNASKAAYTAARNKALLQGISPAVQFATKVNGG